MATYPHQSLNTLTEALKVLNNEAEMKAFLRDLFTPKEIAEAANRLNIAKTLWTTDKTYLEIAQEFKTSTTTVTRVADWLYHQSIGGFRTLLSRLYPKQYG
jgi:TrpR-related protein YerC/YecD